jgi:hypothetical protein
MNERAHALCSASGAERWLNCPGSLHAAKDLPPEPPSVYAQEGTRAHWYAETILRAWIDKGQPKAFPSLSDLRALFPGPEHEDAFSPGDDNPRGFSMLDYVLTYVNLCIDEVEAFDSPGPAIRIEQRLVLDEGMGMFGTADFLVTGNLQGKSVGVIVDLKYGKGKRVKTDNNPQLAYYAVGLLKSSKKPLEEIKVRVVQPRIDEYFSERWYSRKELKAWEEQLILGAENAMWQLHGSRQRFLLEGPWCFFCPARKVCPELEKKRVARMASGFDVIDE